MERYDNAFAQLKARQEVRVRSLRDAGRPRPGAVAEDYRHPD